MGWMINVGLSFRQDRPLYLAQLSIRSATLWAEGGPAMQARARRFRLTTCRQGRKPRSDASSASDMKEPKQCQYRQAKEPDTARFC